MGQITLSSLLSVTLTVVAVSSLVMDGHLAFPVIAQTQPEPINPLNTPIPDPLLPQTARTRPLTPLEGKEIQEAAQSLNQQATTQLENGNIEAAFELWYRQLRLQRALGRLEEVKALGQVGAIAWNQNRPTDVKFITARLQEIELAATTRSLVPRLEKPGLVAPPPGLRSREEDGRRHSAASDRLPRSAGTSSASVPAPAKPDSERQRTDDPPLLQALAQSYEQVRALEAALEAYQQILEQQPEDAPAREATLEKIGELQLARFNYLEATPIYQELLEIARSRSDFYRQGIYLSQLAEIYNQSAQPENAIDVKEQLAERYLNQDQIQKLPALKISIGSDYEALKRPEAASQNYQEAFSLAWSLQQLATASEALQKLGNLYRAYEQEDYALQVYQELLKVEQQSYDYYGLMKTYDRIGQIYLKQQDYPQALRAYEQALALARSLKYQEAYFAKQIEQINQQIAQ